ncbi:MAG: HigA family addiction module antidote protein [Rhizobacter sp.]|nr:HigA family addiction module antidote protein [Bacteriovorax sp.]
MSAIKYKRKPTLPGEILTEEFLKPLQITQKQLADHIKVDIKVINRLVNGRTSLSAEMALKLSATFQNSADFWLSAQYENDLYEARKLITKLPRPIVKE